MQAFSFRHPLTNRLRRQTFVGKKTVLAASVVACTVLGSMLPGCGSKPAPTAQATTQEAASVAAAKPEIPAPRVIVSQFLDRVRRGGGDAGASELLTKLAQQEMIRIGRPLQFPGSPNTRFEVRGSFEIPDQPDAVWVQSYLAEPMADGNEAQYEVVWTLRKENDGWRISGFATEQEGGSEMRIDFENGEEMEARIAAAMASEAVAESQTTPESTSNQF